MATPQQRDEGLDFLVCTEAIFVRPVRHVRILCVSLFQMMTDYQTGRHRAFGMHAHGFLNKIKKGCVLGAFDAYLASCDGEGDHVRLLVNYLPKCRFMACIGTQRDLWPTLRP